VDKKWMAFKLEELRYLSYIFFMVHNQLIRYTEAFPDVMNYVLSTLSSTVYIEPPSEANKNVLYYQLFEELWFFCICLIFFDKLNWFKSDMITKYPFPFLPLDTLIYSYKIRHY
jgi:hypothetical protein